MVWISVTVTSIAIDVASGASMVPEAPSDAFHVAVQPTSMVLW